MDLGIAADLSMLKEGPIPDIDVGAGHDFIDNGNHLHRGTMIGVARMDSKYDVASGFLFIRLISLSDSSIVRLSSNLKSYYYWNRTYMDKEGKEMTKD